MKKIMKIIKKNKMNFMLIAISIVAFITGIFAIGWVKSLLIVGIIDILLFALPVILDKVKKKKNKNTKQSTKTNKKVSKSNKPKKKKIFKIILIGLFVLGIIALIATFLFFFMIAKKSPNFDPDKLYKQESTVIYDKDGQIFAKLGVERREKISYDEMPEVLIDAIIATEDARFFQHNGFDLPRFLKASFGQISGNSAAGGASTITMQVVKNSFTSKIDKGFQGVVRKFTDIYMAIFKVEKSYTKKEILEFYANSYYLGSGAYGVEQAALTYFGKSAKDLNLSEASLIAGLFQSPSAYSPYNDIEAANKRRNIVLTLMERHGYINKKEREVASAISIESLLNTNNTTSKEYQDFIDTVAKEVDAKTGNNIYTVPMEIYTTMDREKQEHVNKIMRGESFAWENDFVDAGISVIDTQTGAIVAIGAGRHRTGEGKFNNATQIERQTGSSAKPLFDYGPGIEYNNWSTFTPWTDEPHSYNDKEKKEVYNWDGGYNGWMTSRDALVYSRNIPALKSFQKIPNANIYKFVTSLGLHPELDGTFIHEAHSIGGYNGESPTSMGAAYATFANEGYYIEPYSFTKIIYRENDEVFEHKYQEVKAMSEETAYMVNDMLVSTSKYALFQFGNVNGYNYAAKTGTTNFDDKTKESKKLPQDAINDLWVIGMTDEYSIGVWYGYEKIDPNYITRFGNAYHSAIFQAVAKGVFSRSTNITKPNDVVAVQVEKGWMEAYLPSKHTPADLITTELFKKGTEPTVVSKRFSQLANVSNLDGELGGNVVSLSWDPIDTPDAINGTFLADLFKKMFNKPDYQTANLNARIAYNNSYIGKVAYDIYVLKTDGTSQLVGTTDKTNINIQIYSTSKPITYIVKSAYSIFKNNASTGTSLTLNFEDAESIVYSQLNGDATINLKVNTIYTDPGITVYDNALDITDSSTITKIYRNTDTSQTVTSINYGNSGNYTITYNVKYNDYTKTHVRTIKITE